MASSESHNIHNGKRAVRKAHFKLNRAFKVIPDHPCWCRQKSRTVCGRNVQLMADVISETNEDMAPENGTFVAFNDPTQV